MSNTRKLVVEILGDAKGMTKATKEAESGLAAFESKVGKIGSALAGVFAGGALLSFGKQAAEAALEDQRAQERLAKTLQNVTNATREQIGAVEDYISKTESQYAVIDDELRPAFETLVRATKDTAQAQQLLQLALDVSAGSGKSLQEVSVALVKAMGGQMRGLKDLGINIKDTEGKTLSFAGVYGQLTATFGGQGLLAAQSQTGQLNTMRISYENLKESIGRALLPVMMQLASVANTLFGWFNNLDSGTQRLLVQVATFTAIGYTAVKMFGAMKAAIEVMRAQTIATEGAIGALGLSIGSLTGILGVAAAAYLLLSNRKKEASDASADFASALSEESTSIQADIARALSADPKVIDLMERAGIKASDVLAFVTDKTKLGSDANRDLTKKLYGTAEGFVLLRDTLQPMRQAYLDNEKKTKANAEATKQLGEITWGLLGPTRAATVSVDEYNKRLNEQIGFQKQAEAAMNKTTQAILEAADQIRAKFDAKFAADKAMLEASKGLKQMHDDLKGLKKSSQEYKVVVEEQADKTLSAAEAVGELAKKQSGLTGAQADAVKNRAMLEYLKDMAFKLDPKNPLQRYLAEWIVNLNSIPGSISTDVKINWRDNIPAWARDAFSKGWSTHYQPVTTAQALPGRASGGPVMAGKAYMVGERGPEVFVPGQSGGIIPNGAGGNTFQIHVNAGMGADPQSIGNAVVSALRSWVRTNGKLAGVAA